MSRLLEALRSLQQPAEADDAAPSRKITPRLATSIRKAVLGDAAVTQAAESQVLFRMPEAEPADVAPSSESKTELILPDPVRLVETIQASISSVQQEIPPPPATVPIAPTIVSQPAPSQRPQPTPTETELRALLSSEAHSRPYRDLLATVSRGVVGKLCPVVAIVGLDEQDATAHVAAALSTLFADQQTKTTLLIEANPARNLSRFFGLSPASGLAEILAGRAQRSGAVAATSHPRLDLLPFGQATAEQAQLLPQVLAAEIAQLRTMHGSAVIDAGSLSSPWALTASQAADAVYLVVRVGNTSAEFASACVQTFRAAGGKLTGCIAVGAAP